MSYRLINANDLNGKISDEDYKVVLDAPCIYTDLPKELDGRYYGLSERKIIEYLRFAIDSSTGDTDYMVGLRNGLRVALASLDGEKPQFEDCQSKKGEWIPVSERLPEYGERVFILLQDGRVYSADFNCGDVDWWFEIDNGWEYSRMVRAWMPIPEYEEGAIDESIN